MRINMHFWWVKLEQIRILTVQIVSKYNPICDFADGKNANKLCANFVVKVG